MAGRPSRVRGSSILSRSRAPTRSGGPPGGYDAGKKINGRKRFIVTDTMGLLITVMVCAASVQDRDGAKSALLGTYLSTRRCRLVFADAGCAGRLVEWATRVLGIMVDIVRKPEGQKGLSVLPRRWAVERTLAWITAHRRLARDYERNPAHAALRAAAGRQGGGPDQVAGCAAVFVVRRDE
jgi:transposase